MISSEVLRRYACFAGVRDETLREIASFSEDMAYKAGEQLFHENDDAAKLFLLTHGRADILFELRNGERRIVDTLVAGDVLSWSAIVEPHRLTASCIARDDCEVLVIDGPRLRELCANDTLLGYRMMYAVARELSSRLRGARVQLAVA